MGKWISRAIDKAKNGKKTLTKKTIWKINIWRYAKKGPTVPTLCRW
jgi:hypothetical protein